jgi:hypothetical protein
VRGAPTPVERFRGQPARLVTAVAAVGLGIVLVSSAAAMAGTAAGPVTAAGIVGLGVMAAGLAWRPRGLEWVGFAVVAASVALGAAEGDDASWAPILAAGLALLGELTDVAVALRSPARMERTLARRRVLAAGGVVASGAAVAGIAVLVGGVASAPDVVPRAAGLALAALLLAGIGALVDRERGRG